MQSKTTFLLLKISTFLVFIGRAYQLIFWGVPHSSLPWEEQLLKLIIQVNGFFYLFVALLVLFIQLHSKKWMKYGLYIGGFSLLFLSFLLFKEKSYQIPQFFEHSLQFGVVFTLLYYLKNSDTKKFVFYLKVLITLTFISHGIYALGLFYPIPGNFITMVLHIIPIQESQVVNFLFLMGMIDLLVAILLFVPKLSKWVVLYAFIWGILTALARMLSGLHDGFFLAIFHQYFFETVYRLVHGLVPLAVYKLLRN